MKVIVARHLLLLLYYAALSIYSGKWLDLIRVTRVWQLSSEWLVGTITFQVEKK